MNKPNWFFPFDISIKYKTLLLFFLIYFPCLYIKTSKRSRNIITQSTLKTVSMRVSYLDKDFIRHFSSEVIHNLNLL